MSEWKIYSIEEKKLYGQKYLEAYPGKEPGCIHTIEHGALIEAEERIAKLVGTMLDVAKVLDGIKSSDDFTTVYWARDQLEVSAEHIAELSKAQGEK